MTPPLAFLDGFGGGEVMWIMLIALLLFGGDKLPGLAKGMGKAIREFKKAAGDVENELKRAMEEVPDTPRPKPPTVFPPYPPAAASPAATSADPDGAYPYGSGYHPPDATTTPPASDTPPPAAPAPKPPGDQPPPPPAPPSPYDHLSDL